MGYWVLEQGLAQLAKWRRELYLSLNLSPVQMRQPDFVERVLEAVERHQVDPRSVMFEITESVLVDEGDHSSVIDRSVAGTGCPVAIDDFGDGYRSLSHLQAIEYDLLTIDRGQVRRLRSRATGNPLTRRSPWRGP